jgi:hypothetical protein
MAIFRFFSKKKRQPTLLRCTYCNYEFHLSPREVRLLCTQNAGDPVCPAKELCDICHIGFMIPVEYTDKQGNVYLFSEIKPKTKNQKS